jgi:hypothetical protein
MLRFYDIRSSGIARHVSRGVAEWLCTFTAREGTEHGNSGVLNNIP